MKNHSPDYVQEMQQLVPSSESREPNSNSFTTTEWLRKIEAEGGRSCISTLHADDCVISCTHLPVQDSQGSSPRGYGEPEMWVMRAVDSTRLAGMALLTLGA